MPKRDQTEPGAPSAQCAQRLSRFRLRRLHVTGSTQKRIGRYSRDLEACQFQSMIDSWDLHMRAEKKSAKTIRTYLEAA
jgi:hypothetical protein